MEKIVRCGEARTCGVELSAADRNRIPRMQDRTTVQSNVKTLRPDLASLTRFGTKNRDLAHLA